MARTEFEFQKPDILHPLSSLEWQELPSLPNWVVGPQIACMDGIIYVGGLDHQHLYSFNPGRVDSVWKVTALTPTFGYGLVVHDSQLLLVGGIYPSWQITNMIFTMNNTKSFMKKIPPMEERRYSSSAVSTGRILVVAGGIGTSGPLSSVEIFKDGSQWTSAPSLPNRGCYIKSTLHGDYWSVVTGSSVFRTSVSSLISGTDQSPWETLPYHPNVKSAIVYFGGRLLSIGDGCHQNSTSSIYAFSSHSRTWVHVADLPNSLDNPSVTVLHPGKLVVIGGVHITTRVFKGSMKVTPFSHESRFGISTLNQLEASMGISVIKELTPQSPSIAVEAGVDMYKMYRDILEKWILQHGPHPPTWAELFRVLKESDLGDLAVQIEKHLGGSPSLPDVAEDLSDVEEEEDDKRAIRNRVVPEQVGINTELEGEASRSPGLRLRSGKIKTEPLPYFVKEEPEPPTEYQHPPSVQKKEENDDETLKLKHVVADKIAQLNKENESLKNEIYALREEVYYLQTGKVTTKSWYIKNEKPHTDYQPATSVEKWEPKDEPQTTEQLQLEVPQESALQGPLSQPLDESFDLPGVEVVGRATVMVTNSVLSFHWAGYGFKLHIPQNSLPAGVDHCRLDIIVSVVGQYQLPDNQTLASAVYWVRPDPMCRFQEVLAVEIQHCVKVYPSTKLCFVRASCSQKSLPYTFKKLEGQGVFSPESSSFGCLTVNSFSGLAVCAEGAANRQYLASFYYLTLDPRSVEIHFVITWNDEPHITEAKRYCDHIGAVEKSFLEIEFTEDRVSLDIPMPQGVTVEEWKLTPRVPPTLSRKRVDSFSTGRKLPSCQLRASLSHQWREHVPERSHLVTLHGAKDPDNQMVIVLDEFNPIDNVQTKDPAGPSRLSLEQSHTSLTLSPATHPPPPHWAMQLQHRSLTGRSDSGVTGQGDFFHSMTGTASGSTRAIEYPAVTLDQLVEHVGIDKDLLNKECTEKSMQTVAPLLHNWVSFAKKLGFTDVQIQDVLYSHYLSTEMKALRVLEMWHRRYGFNATYQHLVDVCLSLGDVSVATELCKALKEDHPSEDSSRPALTGEKRRQEEVTEHTEEEQVHPKRPRPEVTSHEEQ